MPTINGRACVANGRNLIVQSDLKGGYLDRDNGNMLPWGNTDFNSDKYIATNGATVLTFSSPDYVFKGNWLDTLAMYDSDKNYLGWQSITSATQTLSKPNVAYIRFSINFTDEGGTAEELSDWLANHRYKLEKGSVATPLTPAPVDKVFSNGKQVYSKNLWIMSKVVHGYLPAATGLPTLNSNTPDAVIPDPIMIPVNSKSLVMTIYNPNKLVNTANASKPSFFNGSTYLGMQKQFNLTGDAVQTVKWNIPAGATKAYLASLLGPANTAVFDPSIYVKYEFDVATPWTPAPEDVM